MLVGVLSDTHDRLPAIDRALSLFERRKVQAVIHPGDVVLVPEGRMRIAPQFIGGEL